MRARSDHSSSASSFAIRFGLLGSVALSLGACGSPPPAAPPSAALAPIVAEKKAKPVDTSPVPEPPGLVVVARVTRPEAIVSAVGSWTHLPLPAGRELVRSITDDSVADVVDPSLPVDAAVTVGLSRHGIDPLMAFAVAVKSFDEAKTKLGAGHRLVPGPNGSFKVEGLGKRKHASRPPPPSSPRTPEAEDEEDDEEDGCVLAPSATGGRLVCGEAPALEALTPYLSRTMPREKWSSDVHLEVRPEPVRAPLMEMRSSLPVLARSLMGSQSPAVREFIDASLGELMDVVNDAQKLSVDAQIADSGIVATTRFEFQARKSTFARMLTMSDRADATPASFWHLPGDTDTAFFGRGSDPKLFDRPRELIANLMLEATDSAGMPEAERKAVRDLVADRMLALFTSGTGIYAKGFDQAGVEKAMNARKGLKWEDRAGQTEAQRVLLEQVVGWHVYQVNEPVAKVGPILKDWSALWNRPAFSKWAQSKADGSPLPRMRVAPAPAGVTLPKETVHLEVTIPREDLEDMAPPPPPRATPASPAVAKAGKPKKIPRKPIVFHVFAVPDGGATWLGFGLDAKLVAQKAAASIASASDANTLGKIASGYEALREGKINGGGIATLRGLAVIAAFDDHGRSPFTMLGALAHKGATPIVFTGRAEGPSATAKAGSSVGSVRISRDVIEDVVKLVMSAR